MIRVTGFFNEVLGIGRGAQMTAGALEGAGYAVVREDLRPLHHKLLSRAPADFDAPAEVWLIHANPPETGLALMAHRAEVWADMYRIAYWVWESDLVPADWVWAAQFMHEIWVPSDFVREAFARSFTAAGQAAEIAKLRVKPHPVRVPEPLAETDRAEVSVLTLFDPRSSLERKNPEAAIRVWRRAFPQASASARLLIKTHSGADRHPACQALRQSVRDRPDIGFMCETLDDAATLALIADSDVVVSLHRGEGFGLPLAEAMAAGKAVLATGWSGNMQFMNANSACPVPFRLIPADKRHNGPAARWAEPDIDAAAESLKKLVADKGLRQRLGAQARTDIAALQQAWAASELFQ